MSRVVTVAERTDAADRPARAATLQPIAEPSPVARPSSALPPSGSDDIPPPDAASSTATSNGSASESPTFAPSELRTSISKKRWQRPRNVRQFVAQVNDVATAILNGDLSDEELDRARIYAGLTRVVAQGMTTEVQRARFLKQAPDLEFEDAEE